MFSFDKKDENLFNFRNGEIVTVSPKSKMSGNNQEPPLNLEKLENDLKDSYWTKRDTLENQMRQHFLARNRYIAEQNTRLPYPNVYGAQYFSKFFFQNIEIIVNCIIKYKITINLKKKMSFYEALSDSGILFSVRLIFIIKMFVFI